MTSSLSRIGRLLLTWWLALAAGDGGVGSPATERADVARGAGSTDSVPLRVALLPDESPATVIKKNEPLRGYLEAAIKRKIELIVTTDYSLTRCSPRSSRSRSASWPLAGHRRIR
jgi:phosphonate transport system substrate-binding protein